MTGPSFKYPVGFKKKLRMKLWQDILFVFNLKEIPFMFFKVEKKHEHMVISGAVTKKKLFTWQESLPPPLTLAQNMLGVMRP